MAHFSRTLAGAIAGCMLMAAQAAADVRLIFFDREGCYYCERWKSEIMPAYDKTPEGRIAPLTILDIDDPIPGDIRLKARPYLSPTFVLLDDNAEVARIEGYPGEELFWWMLDGMIAKLPAQKRKDPRS